MNIVLDNYTPLISYLSPASIPQIVAHIQDYLLKHPILSVETVAEIIVQSLQEHPELLNGEAIPISADSEQSIKAYIDALPFLDTYTKAEINALLLGKQDTLTFDQAPTPGSSNPVTSSGIIAALSALQATLETLINAKADSSTTYTKTQVDTLLEDKADADDVYSKNTMDAKLLEVNTDIDNLEDALSDQSQQIGNLTNLQTTVKTDIVSAINSLFQDTFNNQTWTPQFPRNTVSINSATYTRVGNVMIYQANFLVTASENLPSYLDIGSVPKPSGYRFVGDGFGLLFNDGKMRYLYSNVGTTVWILDNGGVFIPLVANSTISSINSFILIYTIEKI